MPEPAVSPDVSVPRATRWRRLAGVTLLGASVAAAGWLLRSPDPVEPAHRSAGPVSPATTSRSIRRLGVRLHELDATARRAGFHGLMVDAVQDVAARAGVRVGDCILQANGEPVDTPADLARHVSDEAATVGLLLRRGERHVFIPIKLSS